MERRDSCSSESSLEHLHLVRTTNKLNTLSTSTPHNNINIATLASKSKSTNDSLHTQHHQSPTLDHDSDEANDYDDESADENHTSSRPYRHHHKRRSCGRLEKRNVQLDYNTVNPNSLRKKFRFNRNIVEVTNMTMTNNESGFIDGSGSTSQLLNTSASSFTSPPMQHSSSEIFANSGSQSSSSEASSPHGASASASSAESGIGERDDMKFVCPICEVVSATPHEFTNHIRCHNYSSGDTDNFTCRICSKILSSASSLDRHVLVHTGERPFNCKYCHLTFTTNGNMHRHMRTHKQHQHNHQRRNSNGITSSSKYSVKNILKTFENETTQLTPTVVVPVSAKIFNDTINDDVFEPNTRTATLTPSSLIVETCVNGKRFNGSGVESYESDVDGCSTDSSSAISQSSCKHNNNNAKIIDSQNNNNKKHNNIYKRKSSDNLDDDIALMKRRVKTTVNNNIIVASDENYNITDVGTDRIACPVCSCNDFDSMLVLSMHMDSVHCNIPAKCRYCDVVFHTHKQLNIHPCKGKLPIPSSIQNMGTYVDISFEKISINSMSLNKHSVHPGSTGKYLGCPHCNLVFSCTNAFEMHVNGCHIQKPDGLPKLLRQVKQRNDSESFAGLEKEAVEVAEGHLQRCDDFVDLLLKNKSCNLQDMSPLMSPQHSLEYSHDLNEIKYETECEKVIQESHDNKDLADIQSILNMTSSSTSNFLKNFEHSVNTPSSNYGVDKDEEEAQDAFTSDFRKMKLRGEFPCKLCKAVFPNLRALKGHNRIHLSAANPTGPFRCNMCPFSICDKAALVRHMRTHNGDRPYECAVCNYAFTTKANCERHLRNRHSKITRDDVKRAIIYHPSEDSTCDDTAKKLNLFSSPEFEDDDELHHQPKDRSTPVSHLKEMLTCDEISTEKNLKIQVKSLEELLDKSTTITSYNDDFKHKTTTKAITEQAPMDLSMDVLDLSKKSAKSLVSDQRFEGIMPTTTPVILHKPSAQTSVYDRKFDFSVLKNNQQYLLAQQQLINNALPKIVDPGHYLQQLYRNLVFPPINPLNPFFLQNNYLPTNLGELQKYAPLMNIYVSAPSTIDTASKPTSTNSAHMSSTMLPQVSPLMSEKSSVSSVNSGSPVSSSQLLTQSTASKLTMPRNTNMTPTVLPGGPVKMVIKNGVLMPKQKQRRYRTERPFSCEHCSARFTLRSNMERHVKQQHPQFYAQRQRGSHHIMRGRGTSNPTTINSINQMHAAISVQNAVSCVGPTSISEQVKYAILAQQLNTRNETDLLQQALSHGSRSVTQNQLLSDASSNMSQLMQDYQLNIIDLNNFSHVNGSMEDDEPKLIIDEEEDIEEIFDDNDEGQEYDAINETLSMKHTLPVYIDQLKSECKNINEAAKKVDGNIFQHASQTDPARDTAKTMIAQAESVGKFLKDLSSSSLRDESQDLVPVSKLVDNATTNSMSFNNYFRPSDVVNHMEQSDEEGLVASGSASESNNSGTEDISSSAEPKKKSAYSLAPNRVSCPYCQRMFPWSSSLRRHILTHTGQKPFKCSHCPLLFTTKSNCDRHLLRKHGNVESAVSVYVPTEDVNEPIPVPKSVEEIEQHQRKENERKRKVEEAVKHDKDRNDNKVHSKQEHGQYNLLKQLTIFQIQQTTQTKPDADSSIKSDANASIQPCTEEPFKCHLCDSSFGERFQCLDHIKIDHSHDFALLVAKGAIDNDSEPNFVNCTEEERPGEDSNVRSGKYPDYSNRKVICAFCMRRFWSTEDLRRHMRTHSGERPFKCDICMRKFTLKHSMLRHMKKHNGSHHSSLGGSDLSNANSGSDLSDDEQIPTSNSMMVTNTIAMRTHKIQDLLNKASEWRASRLSMGEHKENISEEHNNHTDLIGNLLGISDQSILNKLLSSADEAAKLLGVEK